MIVFIFVGLICAYLLLNVLHNISIVKLFGKQSVYLSVKDLKRYRSPEMRLGFCTVEFDYMWGVKATPFSFWYLLYITFCNSKIFNKVPWDSYL